MSYYNGSMATYRSNFRDFLSAFGSELIFSGALCLRAVGQEQLGRGRGRDFIAKGE